MHNAVVPTCQGMATEPNQASPRRELLSAAARIVTQEGVERLSIRRLAQEVGTSTMAVYTWFGSKPNLMRALYREGFSRFRSRLRRVRPTADPITDLIGLGQAYRRHALADPDLYEIMFGRNHRFFPAEADDVALARETFQMLVDTVGRCVAAGDLDCDPDRGAQQVWAAMHGAVSLELATRSHGGGGPFDASIYPALTATLLVGLGGEPDRIAARIRASAGSPGPAPRATSR